MFYNVASSCYPLVIYRSYKAAPYVVGESSKRIYKFAIVHGYMKYQEGKFHLRWLRQFHLNLVWIPKKILDSLSIHICQYFTAG